MEKEDLVECFSINSKSFWLKKYGEQNHYTCGLKKKIYEVMAVAEKNKRFRREELGKAVGYASLNRHNLSNISIALNRMILGGVVQSETISKDKSRVLITDEGRKDAAFLTRMRYSLYSPEILRKLAEENPLPADYGLARAAYYKYLPHSKSRGRYHGAAIEPQQKQQNWQNL
jgi:hypothetical protein